MNLYFIFYESIKMRAEPHPQIRTDGALDDGISSVCSMVKY